MPKRVRPRRGYEPPSINYRGESYVDAEKVKQIAADFEILDNTKFEKWLNEIAHLYYFNKSVFEDRPKPRELKAALNEIAELTGKLEHAIESMDSVTRSRLQVLQSRVQSEAFNPDIEIGKFGHHFERRPVEGGEEVDWLRLHEVFQAITILKNLALASSDTLEPGSSGRPKLHAARNLVTNTSSFWIHNLGRELKFWRIGANRRSGVYDFIWAIAQLIDEKILPENIQTALEREISQHRSKIAEKSTPK